MTLTDCSQKKSTWPPIRCHSSRDRCRDSDHGRLGAGRGVEQQARHVRRRADAAMGLLEAVAVLVHVGDELAEVLRGKSLRATMIGGECAVGLMA